MAQSTHPLRIFAFSVAVTLITFLAVWHYMGMQAALLTALLCIIEITFSFDNAIINARILKTLSPLWQQLFLTVGVVIAVFGMRLVFPIVIVAVTSSLPWNTVVDLALNQPEKYAAALEHAQPLIASFGGAFLLMLGLHYFFDREKTTHWLPMERVMSRGGAWWIPMIITAFAVLLVAFLPGHHSEADVLVAGGVGIVLYLLVHGLSTALENRSEFSKGMHKTGVAAFVAFIYLQILDASFSLDGVIGAFAITSDVIIIAAGLGVGAFWVRSMTVYMVRKDTLGKYQYLEHGAHYTILLLAFVLLASIFFHLPEFIPGLLGITVIGLAVYSSVKQKSVAS